MTFVSFLGEIYMMIFLFSKFIFQIFQPRRTQGIRAIPSLRLSHDDGEVIASSLKTVKQDEHKVFEAWSIFASPQKT